MVKRAATQLMREENLFNADFEHNKALLRNSMPSKPIKNRVAGYITRLVRSKSKPKKIKIQAQESET